MKAKPVHVVVEWVSHCSFVPKGWAHRGIGEEQVHGPSQNETRRTSFHPSSLYFLPVQSVFSCGATVCIFTARSQCKNGACALLQSLFKSVELQQILFLLPRSPGHRCLWNFLCKCQHAKQTPTPIAVHLQKQSSCPILWTLRNGNYIGLFSRALSLHPLHKTVMNRHLLHAEFSKNKMLCL